MDRKCVEQEGDMRSPVYLSASPGSRRRQESGPARRVWAGGGSSTADAGFGEFDAVAPSAPTRRRGPRRAA